MYPRPPVSFQVSRFGSPWCLYVWMYVGCKWSAMRGGGGLNALHHSWNLRLSGPGWCVCVRFSVCLPEFRVTYSQSSTLKLSGAPFLNTVSWNHTLINKLNTRLSHKTNVRTSTIRGFRNTACLISTKTTEYLIKSKRFDALCSPC